MTLLEATAERLFELILIGGVGLAVVVYIIRKQLRNPQNDPVTVIGLWVLSFVVFLGITYSAIAAQEGFVLIFVLLVAVALAVLLGLAWTPTIANTLSSPLTTAFSGDDTEAYEGPAYGQALAKRKRGQYEGAVEAVEIQLEQYPGDFDGLMLKATIQAENLDDLPAAVATERDWGDASLPSRQRRLGGGLDCHGCLQWCRDPMTAYRCPPRVQGGLPRHGFARCPTRFAKRLSRMGARNEHAVT